MEIVSENVDNKNITYIPKVAVVDENSDSHSLKSTKTESIIYSLNPLLNESLNNLVKRFERTKIPKPPPTKGHGIRRKTIRSYPGSSMPNIFLPSTFDSNVTTTSSIGHGPDCENFNATAVTSSDSVKYFDGPDKKVQWTNKLNLDLERMKTLFLDNYSHWSAQQLLRNRRIQSISLNVLNSCPSTETVAPPGSADNEPDQNAHSHSQDASKENAADFICSRSQDDKNMTIKFTKCDRRPQNTNNNNSTGSKTGFFVQNNENGDQGLETIGNENAITITRTKSKDIDEGSVSRINNSSSHNENITMDINDRDGDGDENMASYSTHLYLDGAIIEPISPASPVATASIVSLPPVTDPLHDSGTENRTQQSETTPNEGIDSKMSITAATAIETMTITTTINDAADDSTMETDIATEKTSTSPSKAKRGRKSRRKKPTTALSSSSSSIPPTKKAKQQSAITSDSCKDRDQSRPDFMKKNVKTESKDMSNEAVNSNEIIIIHLGDNIDLINLDEMPKRNENPMTKQQQKNSSSSPAPLSTAATISVASDQPTNDLEILSKSITTTSVDTSMLPPRKRYKRLMYFENTAKSASPRDLPPSVIDSHQKDSTVTGDLKSFIQDNQEAINFGKDDSKFDEDKTLSSKLSTGPRSRSKRKKKTAPSLTKSTGTAVGVSGNSLSKPEDSMTEVDVHSENESGIASVTSQQLPSSSRVPKIEQTLQISTTGDTVSTTPKTAKDSTLIQDTSTKPESLKRSKREAAARGFANMVAMSLNNSNSIASGNINSNTTSCTQDNLEVVAVVGGSGTAVTGVVNDVKQCSSSSISSASASCSLLTTTTTTVTRATPNTVNDAMETSGDNKIAMTATTMTSKVSFKRPRKSKAVDQIIDSTSKSKMIKSDAVTMIPSNGSSGTTTAAMNTVSGIVSATSTITSTLSSTLSVTSTTTITTTSSRSKDNHTGIGKKGGTKKSKEINRVSHDQDSTNLQPPPPPSPSGTIISNDSNSHHDNNIKYRRIRTNTYVDPKPLYWFEEVERCGCKPSKLRYLYENQEINKIATGNSDGNTANQVTTNKKNKNGNKTKSIIDQSSCSAVNSLSLLLVSSESSPSAINDHTNSKKKKKRHSPIVWDCSDSCLNRLTYTECQAKQCQCGDACGNQKIRKGEWVPGLKTVDCPGKGRGVITTRSIREGTFIMEYVGEVINELTFQDRMMNLYRDDPHHFCLHLDGDMLIDAYRSGSMARFVNHSCQPNCEMQKWMVNGAYRMCLFAVEDIAPDTELCYDYNFCSFNTKNTQICLCGSASCRGFIGSKPRPEQTESQKDRKKLLYVFGRLLSGREKLFILRNSIFLLRNRERGRCQRLGIRKPQFQHGNRLPSTISEIKRRKAKKNQFLTQMSALNSIRSIKTRQLQNAQDNDALTRLAQLGQVLKDLYNTLLDQKDPLTVSSSTTTTTSVATATTKGMTSTTNNHQSGSVQSQHHDHHNYNHRQPQQLVAPFINCLNRKKYPEFYRMIGLDSVASLSQIYNRLLDGHYQTMMAFDQDVLQMLHNVEFYAGKHSNIGQCAERIKPIYRELKSNSIALYEALTDEIFDEKDKQKLLSNNLQLITSALAAMKTSQHHHQNHHLSNNNQEVIGGINSSASDLISSISEPVSTTTTTTNHKIKRRKQTSSGAGTIGCGSNSSAGARNRLERGAEVIKCICGFLIEAGHVMVQCDRCFVWQHAYCMNVARSSELADVTRMEPYYCHICLNIPQESLIREIPRHFVITDETIGSDNTLFWTLLHSDNNLLKIDDFVYISHSAAASIDFRSNASNSNNNSNNVDNLDNKTVRTTAAKIETSASSGSQLSAPTAMTTGTGTQSSRSIMRSSKQSKSSPANVGSITTTEGLAVSTTLTTSQSSMTTTGPQNSNNSPTTSTTSSMPIDLTLRTIMRIYSLWKDSSGRRWMEGGLFLRPYDSQLKSLLDKRHNQHNPKTTAAAAAATVGNVTTGNKRKLSSSSISHPSSSYSSSSQSPIDLNTHKWHQYELVYTDLTRILPVDECLGRCFVLNSYTFRQGRPLLQNGTNQNQKNLDVFVCDWMINQHGDWSELDPAYLKINTKAYCFERFQDSANSNNCVAVANAIANVNTAVTVASVGAGVSDCSPVSIPSSGVALAMTAMTNERFCRQYLSQDLLGLDKGFLPLIESNNQKVVTRNLSQEERISRKMQSLKKLLNKLVDFAYERNRNLPLSSSTSSASGSTASSRGASPLCENSGSKSPLRPLMETVISHGPRKSFNPRKLPTKCDEEIVEKINIVHDDEDGDKEKEKKNGQQVKGGHEETDEIAEPDRLRRRQRQRRQQSSISSKTNVIKTESVPLITSSLSSPLSPNDESMMAVEVSNKDISGGGTTITSDASDSSPQLMIVVDEIQQSSTPKTNTGTAATGTVDGNRSITTDRDDNKSMINKKDVQSAASFSILNVVTEEPTCPLLSIDEENSVEDKTKTTTTTVSSLRENLDVQSNFGSEINFGDFVNLLKNSSENHGNGIDETNLKRLSSTAFQSKVSHKKVATGTGSKKAPTTGTTGGSKGATTGTSSRKKSAASSSKRNEIKPVSEISAAEDDEWVPVTKAARIGLSSTLTSSGSDIGNGANTTTNRPRTRSRKSLLELTPVEYNNNSDGGSCDKKISLTMDSNSNNNHSNGGNSNSNSNSNADVELILTGLNIKGIFTSNEISRTTPSTSCLPSSSTTMVIGHTPLQSQVSLSSSYNSIANIIQSTGNGGPPAASELSVSSASVMELPLTMLTAPTIKIDEDDDESTKSCFVKLERMKVKQKRERHRGDSTSSHPKSVMPTGIGDDHKTESRSIVGPRQSQPLPLVMTTTKTATAVSALSASTAIAAASGAEVTKLRTTTGQGSISASSCSTKNITTNSIATKSVSKSRSQPVTSISSSTSTSITMTTSTKVTTTKGNHSLNSTSTINSVTTATTTGGVKDSLDLSKRSAVSKIETHSTVPLLSLMLPSHIEDNGCGTGIDTRTTTLSPSVVTETSDTKTKSELCKTTNITTATVFSSTCYSSSSASSSSLSSLSSMAAANRSKRKKGVPKRIPFDFSYTAINPLVTTVNNDVKTTVSTGTSSYLTTTMAMASGSEIVNVVPASSKLATETTETAAKDFVVKTTEVVTVVSCDDDNNNINNYYNDKDDAGGEEDENSSVRAVNNTEPVIYTAITTDVQVTQFTSTVVSLTKSMIIEDISKHQNNDKIVDVDHERREDQDDIGETVVDLSSVSKAVATVHLNSSPTGSSQILLLQPPTTSVSPLPQFPLSSSSVVPSSVDVTTTDAADDVSRSHFSSSASIANSNNNNSNDSIDISYAAPVTCVVTTNISATSNSVVNIMSGIGSGSDAVKKQADTTNTQLITDTPGTAAPSSTVPAVQSVTPCGGGGTTSIVVSTETRHITAANDFSSIENISSN